MIIGHLRALDSGELADSLSWLAEPQASSKIKAQVGHRASMFTLKADPPFCWLFVSASFAHHGVSCGFIFCFTFGSARLLARQARAVKPAGNKLLEQLIACLLLGGHQTQPSNICGCRLHSNETRTALKGQKGNDRIAPSCS